MFVNSKILLHKLDQYYSKAITKQELGSWSKQAYYELMKSEYIEIEKLMIYHFLRKISTVHIIPDDLADEYPCSEEEMYNIREILYGRKDLNYTFNIKIFRNIYKAERYSFRLEEFKKLKEVMNDISQGAVQKFQTELLIKYAAQEPDEIISLIDLLECHIKGIINENIDFEDNTLDFRQSVGVYVGGSSINRENFIPNIKKLLDCVMGDMYFRVSVLYRKGAPYLSLVML